MKTNLFLLALLCFGLQHINAQQDDDILLTVDGEPVYASEFEHVFKKNLDLVQDESQKDVMQYMSLFKDYKLKVKEAEAQGLDTVQKFKREFNTYRSQLARNFLTDTKVTDALVKEAYERTVNEVNASHILIKVDPNASPQDSLKAFNKILDIRKKALAGQSFEQLAKQYSEDPSAKQNGGSLNWFTALRMVYSFENKAYETEVGKVSMPFRTRFGYHILKVNDKRKSKGEVEVAHIMVMPKPNDPTFDPKKRIEEIYGKLQQGEDFEVLAQQFSDDRNSAKEGGKIKRFASGGLTSEVFENEAFKLTEDNPISKPFETKFGWHIAKLVAKYPIASFEELRPDLERRVTNDSRASKISASLVKDLKKKYAVGNQDKAVTFFNGYVTDNISEGTWKVTENPKLNEALLTLNDTTFSYRNFATYVYNKQAKGGVKGDKKILISNWMTDFVNDAVLSYHKANLEKETPEFRAIVSEYRDGLLLFDLMEKNVWNKAKQDSIGLNQFYENHKKDYRQGKRLKVNIAKISNEADAKTVRKLLKKGQSEEEIKQQLNKDENTAVLFNSGTFSVKDEALPKGLKPKTGVSKVLSDTDYFMVVHVIELFSEGVIPLEEAKGRVISDYQNALEKEWVVSLRKKYTVKVNQQTLTKIKNTIEE